MWFETWVRYQKHIVANLSVHVHVPMADYFLFTLETDRKYSWSAITMYDYKHRLTLADKLSLGEPLAFYIEDHTLLPTVLNVTAIKPIAIKCNRCFDFDGKVSSCPFPNAPKGSSHGKIQGGGGKNKTQEICHNFNTDKCLFGETCFRKHQVGSAKEFCHLANAASQGPAMANARTPLNLKTIEANLADHPNKEQVNFIVNGISKGVDIDYKGPQRSLVSDNWPSSVNNHDKVSKAM